MDNKIYFEMAALVMILLAILGMVLIFAVYCISMRYNKEMTLNAKSDLDIQKQKIKTDVKIGLKNKYKKNRTIHHNSSIEKLK